jgi:hypothetical protein
LREGSKGAKKRESTHNDQTASMVEQASTPLSICLSDPQRRDEAAAQEGAQISVKKAVLLGPWIEGERSREPRGAHPAREVGVLRHDAGEGRSELLL